VNEPRARAVLIRICIYERNGEKKTEGHSLCGVPKTEERFSLLPVVKTLRFPKIKGRENSKASTKSGLLISTNSPKTLRNQPIIIFVGGDSTRGSRKKQLKTVFHVLYFFAGHLLSGFRLIK